MKRHTPFQRYSDTNRRGFHFPVRGGVPLELRTKIRAGVRRTHSCRSVGKERLARHDVCSMPTFASPGISRSARNRSRKACRASAVRRCARDAASPRVRRAQTPKHAGKFVVASSRFVMCAERSARIRPPAVDTFTGSTAFSARALRNLASARHAALASAETRW